MALIVTVVVAATGALVFLRGLPDVTALSALPERYAPSTATTRLYGWGEADATGHRPRVLIDEIVDPRQGGAWLALTEMPETIIRSTLAAEDSTYLSSPALDLLHDWPSWRSTQERGPAISPLIRRLISTELGPEWVVDASGAGATAGRAWVEWVLAQQIEARYGRERVLEWLLNTRYYGHLAYGIEAAARVYFGKPASELTWDEATLLAAVGQNPAANPFDDPEAARRGQNEVRDRLVSSGLLTEAEAAAVTFPALAAAPGTGSAAPHFARLARRELEQLVGPERLLEGDLTIETTLDLALQQQAACVMAAYSSANQAPVNSGGGPPCPAGRLLPFDNDNEPPGEGAVVVINPADGTIEALWSDGAGDNLSLPVRPTGSLARPFIYLTALSQGHSAAGLLMDVETIYLESGQPYTPRNADGEFRGPLRLRQAAGLNSAVPATQALSWVGVDRVLEIARALGISTGQDQPPAGLAFVETGFSASLLDLVYAFAAIDNSGVAAGLNLGEGNFVRPATIERIYDDREQSLYTFTPATRDTVDADLAYLLTDILADEPARCPTAGCPEALALSDGRPAAIATGESPPTGDTWTIGYTPDRVIGVWLGGADRGPIDGRAEAALVWHALAEWSSAGTAATDWTRPPGLIEREICAVSGLLPRRGVACPTVSELFVAGTEPAAVDTMVRELAVNRETGRLATIFTPPDLIERRTFIDYPVEAAKWAREAGIPPVPVEYDAVERIATRSGDSAALSLEPWATVSGQVTLNGTAGGDNFAYYRLAAFPGLLPEAMQTIVDPVEIPVTDGQLGVWDTTQLADGLYTVLLTVVKQDGTFAEVAVPVTVSND